MRRAQRDLVSALGALALVPCLFLGACASSGSRPSAGSETADPELGENNPLYSFTLMRQGSILLQQGRYTEALKRFHEADELKPGNATVHNMIGLCHLRMKQYDQSLIAFDRALTLIPNFTDARNNRGATYLALEQYNLAEVDFAAVLGDSTYPHRSEAFYNLGMVYLQQGELGGAEENFRRSSIAARPVYDAFLRLADIAREQGRTETAINLLEEARLRFSDRIEATMELGRMMVDLGRCDRARTLLEAVIAANPASVLAEEAKILLESC